MYNYYQPQMQPLQRHEVIRVTGLAGANTLQLLPNSSCLLLDNERPIVYLVVTDGAGYKTVTSYDITIHKEETHSPLEERVSRLEEIIEQSLA